MFLEHFGLVEQPFGVTPDPRFLHLGRGHREALASLIYGTENNRGFLALIGPPGIGKTSLLFQYLENMRNQARTAFIFQSAGDGQSLMRYLLYDLGQDPAGKDLPCMHQALNAVLEKEMNAGRQLVLVLDEAQNLSPAALEFVRLLSNFETPWAKLLQIVIAGQPQLMEHLAQPAMEQLRQRISSFIHLEPFNPEETSAYVDHRLWAAGYNGPSLFTCGARVAIAEISGGIPRNINNLCFHAMSLAYADGKTAVDSKMVRDAAADSAAGSSVKTFFALGKQTFAEPAVKPLAATNTAEAVEHAPLHFPVLTAPHSARSPLSRFAFASMFTLLFLVIVCGAVWEADAIFHPLSATHSVQASALPKVQSPVPSAPGTMTVREASGAVSARFGPGDFAPTAAIAASIPASPAVPAANVLAVNVEKGTTLRHLTLTYLQRYDPQTVARLCAFNHIADPDQIQVGQTILIPLSLRRTAPVSATAAPARSAAARALVPIAAVTSVEEPRP